MGNGQFSIIEVSLISSAFLAFFGGLAAVLCHEQKSGVQGGGAGGCFDHEAMPVARASLTQAVLVASQVTARASTTAIRGA
jgi:hypothetical protein